MQQASDWMLKHVQDARQLFGVGGPEWHITVSLSDKPLGDSGNDGGVSVDSTYYNATIELKDTLADDETGQQVIYHEVFHIPHEAVDHVVSGIISRLPPEHQQHYNDIYHEAVESFVQRVTRSICAGLRKESDHD